MHAATAETACAIAIPNSRDGCSALPRPPLSAPEGRPAAGPADRPRLTGSSPTAPIPPNATAVGACRLPHLPPDTIRRAGVVERFVVAAEKPGPSAAPGSRAPGGRAGQSRSAPGTRRHAAVIRSGVHARDGQAGGDVARRRRAAVRRSLWRWARADDPVRAGGAARVSGAVPLVELTSGTTGQSVRRSSGPSPRPRSSPEGRLPAQQLAGLVVEVGLSRPAKAARKPRYCGASSSVTLLVSIPSLPAIVSAITLRGMPVSPTPCSVEPAGAFSSARR